MPSTDLNPTVRFIVIGVLCVFATAAGVACLWWMGDWRAWAALGIILAAFGLALWALRPPAGSVRLRMMAVSLCGVIAAACGVQSWVHHIGLQALNELLKRYFPSLPPLAEMPEFQWPLLGFGVVVLLIVFYFSRDSVLPPAPSLESQSTLRLPDFTQRLQWAIDSLKKDITTLNKKLDWSEGRFVELEAELEESNDAGSRTRVRRLVDAMHKTRGREVVLLLGEPGTGKSVAMRRLAMQLLEEAPRSKILALYLNLREWPCPAEWTTTNLPTPEEVTASLWQWVKAQMHQRLDGATNSFTEQYADELLSAGRLFFLLDSFDETRALLDLPKENVLVKHISEGARKLLGQDNEARGIIASRYDRSPARWLNADRWYELRPLENKRIDQLVRQHFDNDPAVWRWLRRQREITMLPRNPFEVFLIAEHLQCERNQDDNRPVFPKHRAEAYASCLQRRLLRAQEWLTLKADPPGSVPPAIDSLRQRLLELTEVLYTGPRGLEVALRDLPPALQAQFPSQVVDALVEARILRAGDGDDRSVGFIHSRFGEALAAQILIAHPDLVSFEDIPSVGRLRDVLIVYFEIAKLESVVPLAEKCYEEIQHLGREDVPASNPLWMRGVRCLRFLDEACRYRREAGATIAVRLADQLRQVLIPEDASLDDAQAGEKRAVDPLTAKLLIEGLSLAPPNRISHLLANALHHPHATVRETAFWACRYLTEAEASFFEQFRKLMLGTPSLFLLHPRWNIVNTLSEVPSLQPLAKLYWAKVVDMFAWMIGIVALSISEDWTFLVFLLLWAEHSTQAFQMWFKAERQAQIRFWITSIRWYVVFMILVLVGKISHEFLWLIPFWAPISPWIFDPRGHWFYFWNDVRTSPTFRNFFKKPISQLVFWTTVGCAWFIKWKDPQDPIGRKAVLAVNILIGLLLLALFMGLALIFFSTLKKLLFASIPGWWRIYRGWACDFHSHRQTMWPKDATNRIWIKHAWDKLSTTYWRNKLVDRLQSIKQVTEEWPDGPPYTGTDSASRRLMRLDERWLGLER